jgi:hypothetical protein
MRVVINDCAMEILLNDAKAIKEIQKEFNREFPYLKVEFFDLPYTPKAPTPKAKMYAAERRLGTIRKTHYEGALDVSPRKTVAEVERELWEKFGLSVQIFRKLGKLWIETNLTDAWTLERQNAEGHELRFDKPEVSGGDNSLDRDK